MDKKDFGLYYNEIRFGERSLFITAICLVLGGSQDQWRRKLLAWGKNCYKGKPLSVTTKDALTRLVRNNFWRDYLESKNTAILD